MESPAPPVAPSTTAGREHHAPARQSAARAPLASQRRPVVVVLATLALLNLAGLPYYRLEIGERVRSPLHDWLRPSGFVGQTAGILALLIFVFLWLYPLRKKARWLAFTGSVARWLDIHILAAIGLPLLVAMHAAWRFEGLVGLGYYAMLVVCASGVVGRYLYVRIPRSRSGAASTRDEVAIERRSLVTEIAAETHLDPFEVERTLEVGTARESRGVARTFLALVLNDVARRRITRDLRRRVAKDSASGTGLDHKALDRIVRLAAREVSLAQQVRMLDATQRVFGYWHVAHRPFAVTALVAVVIHVAVVIALGATWFW